MKTQTGIASLCISLSSEGDRAPEWVQLFPEGPMIKARDGREWILQPETVLAAFAENKGPLAVDYEHGQYHRAVNGLEAPASGWIEELQERDGSVWGRVNWTDEAARKIIAREYRYLSPEFQHTEEGVVLALVGAGLVNRPAFVMTALSRKSEKKEKNMNLQAITEALSLSPGSTVEQVLAAIKGRNDERKAICKSLGLAEDAIAETITGAAEALRTEAATAVASLKKSGGTDAVKKLETELADTRTALASVQKEMKEKAIDTALDAAIAAGKITPAARDDYRAMCAVEGGLDRFTKLVEKLPEIAAPSKLDGKQPATASMDSEADPQAVALAARRYQNEQAGKGINITISAAVDYVAANPEYMK